MKIHNVLLIICLIGATILGIDAQDLSYYLNEKIPEIERTTFISILTFISIGVYIIIPIFTYHSRIPNKMFAFYLIASCVIGIPTSTWSIFVWGMWMG